MTVTELTNYIEANWPEIVDSKHAAQMVEGMQDKHCIDTILAFYVRHF